MESLTYLQDLVGQALSHQVSQFGIAFVIAAWVHANQVKKEISGQMGLVTEAINNVATALRQDLAVQSDRIGNVEKKLINLNSRLETIEKPKET